MKLAFVGLGVMGYPMAGYLARAGHLSHRLQPHAVQSRAWCEEYGGKHGRDPGSRGGEPTIVFCCVGNDDDVREVILGAARCAGRRGRNAISSITPPRRPGCAGGYDAREAKNVDFLDAPLSGGQAGAEAGQLTIMVGGDAPVYGRVLPVMDCYAKACTRIGEVGDGQKAKMVNQICIAGVVQGLPKGCISRNAPAWISRRHRRDIEGRGAVLADGEPLGDHDRRRVRIRFCRGMDAQGPENCAGRGRAGRRDIWN